jgi:hypothetical protein
MLLKEVDVWLAVRGVVEELLVSGGRCGRRLNICRP